MAFEFDNFEAFNETVKGWSTRFNQVSRGLASVRFRHRMSDMVNVLDVKFSHSTASFGSTQAGHRTFGIVGGHGCSWCGYDVDPNQVMRFDAHPDFDTFTPPDFVGRTLSVDENLLAATADRLGFAGFVERLDASSDILTVDPVSMNRYLSIYESRMRSEEDLLNLVEELILLYEDSRDDAPVRHQNASSSHVDAALRYVVEHAQRAITVSEICSELGIGYRTLDRSFKRRLGHGPKASIMAFRLNGVRHDLKRSDPSSRVGAIANAWGFWHMGDFARVYKREFGELPSDTLCKFR